MFHRRRKAVRARALPVVEMLESRVLYSVDAIGGLLPLLLDDQGDNAELIIFPESKAVRSDIEANLLNSSSEGTKAVNFLATELHNFVETPTDITHVLFIDSRVPSGDQLVNSINRDSTWVVRVDSDIDGLLVITKTLSQFQELESVQIVSHGSSGQLNLGSGTIDLKALHDNRAGVVQWANAFAENADILLLGCEVAEGAEGREFTRELASVTGANVAASSDATGHASLNADWDLEFSVGQVDSNILIGTEAQQSWVHSLKEITVDTVDDEFNMELGTTITQLLLDQAAGTQEVSLREAVYAAQQRDGELDKIILPEGTYVLDRGGVADAGGTKNHLVVNEDTQIVGQSADNTAIQMKVVSERAIEVESGSLWVKNLTFSAYAYDQVKISAGGIESFAGTVIDVQDSRFVGIEYKDSESAGGAIHAFGDLAIKRSEFIDNHVSRLSAYATGGAVYAAADINIKESLFEGNVAYSGLDSASGGAVYAEGDVSIESSTFIDNEAKSNGGAVYAGGEAILFSSTFIRNSANAGGGIHVSGSVTVADSTIHSNTASSGAGIYGHTVSLSKSLFYENIANADGGGVYASESATVIDSALQFNSAVNGGGIHGDTIFLSNSLLANNTASDSGGGVYAQTSVGILESSNIKANVAKGFGGGVYTLGTFSIEGSNFEKNSVGSLSGGGLYGEGGGSVVGSTFVGNVAEEDGAGIYAAGIVEINSSLFAENYAKKNGGAIFSNGDTLRIKDSGFSLNVANLTGGAIHSKSNTEIERSSFFENVAQERYGGAIFHESTITLSIDNTTLSGNQAKQGGAVYGERGGSIRSSTFVGNIADEGSVVWSNGYTMSFESSLFSNNTGGSSMFKGDVVSLGFNLTDDVAFEGLTATDLVSATPGLDGVATVGCVSAYLLSDSSIAINAGKDSAENEKDSQGHLRDEISDIGAYEIDTNATVLFWTTEDGSIYRSNIEFTNAQNILENRVDPASITVDMSGSRIYWLEQGNKNLVYTSLDGTAEVSTLLDGLSNATSIAVKSAAEQIFIAFSASNSGSGGRIEQRDVSVDADQLLSIVRTGISPVDLIFDSNINRLIWTENGGSSQPNSIQFISPNNDHFDIFEIAFDSTPGAVASNYSESQILFWGDTNADCFYIKNYLSDNLPAKVSVSETPRSMVFDYVNNRLIWVSNSMNVIYAVNASSLISTSSPYIHEALVVHLDLPSVTYSTNPSLMANAILSIDEGGEGIINEQLLKGSDANTGDNNLRFTVTKAPSNGVLLVDGVASETEFTQAQIKAGLVAYRHNGSESTIDRMELELSDSTYTTDSFVFTIDIKPVNYKPELVTSSEPLEIIEGNAYIFKESDFSVNDVDNITSEFFYKYTSALVAGTMEVDGSELARGDTFTHAQIFGGLVLFRHDGSEQEPDAIDFVVSDGDLNSESSSVSFAFQHENDAPILDVNSRPISILEEGEYVLKNSDLSVHDVDSAEGTLVLSYTTELYAGILSLNGEILAVGDTFTNTQILNGEVAYTHAQSNIATETIVFLASDGVATSEEKSLVFTVEAINDKPELDISGSSVGMLEGGSLSITDAELNATDEDSDRNGFVYRYTSELQVGELQIDGIKLNEEETFTHAELMAAEVVYVHDGEEPGVENIVFVVSDGALESDPSTLKINITPDNDAPLLATSEGLVVLPEGDECTLTTLNLLASDVDNDISDLVFRYTSELLAGYLEVNGEMLTHEAGFTYAQLAAGEVMYQHDGSELHSEEIEFVVSDGSLDSSSVVLRLSMDPRNDAPVLAQTGPIDLHEGGTYVLTAADLPVSDVDTDIRNVIYGYLQAAGAGQLEVDNVVLQASETFTHAQLLSGSVIYRHSGDEPSPEQIALFADDGEARSSSVTLEIRVLPENDAPEFTIDNTTVNENSLGALVGQFTVTDADPGDTATLQVDDERFLIDTNNLRLQPDVALDFESQSRVAIEITVRDSMGAQSVQKMELSVLDLNDVPVVQMQPDTVAGDGFQLPSKLVVDQDGDELEYKATLENGEPLPDWLEFDPIERRFVVKDAQFVQSELIVYITIDDKRGGQVTVSATLQFDPPIATAKPVASLDNVFSVSIWSFVSTEQVDGPAGEISNAQTLELDGSAAKGNQIDVVDIGEVDFVEPLDLQSLIKPLSEFDSLQLAELSGVSELSGSDILRIQLTSGANTMDFSLLLDMLQSDALSQSGQLAQALNSIEENYSKSLGFSQIIVGSSASIATGFSVGYLIWLIRGGTLMGSMLSSLPAWRFVDPLPVLGKFEDHDTQDNETGDRDNESLSSIVETNSLNEPNIKPADPDWNTPAEKQS